MKRRQRGTALIEFTLVLPLLLVLTMAAVDFGRAFFVKNVLEQAAREGCRLAVVTAPDTVLVRERVQTVCNAGGIGPKALSIEGPDAARQVTVRVEADFIWMAPGVYGLIGGDFGSSLTLWGQTTMRHEG